MRERRTGSSKPADESSYLARTDLLVQLSILAPSYIFVEEVAGGESEDDDEDAHDRSSEKTDGLERVRGGYG